MLPETEVTSVFGIEWYDADHALLRFLNMSQVSYTCIAPHHRYSLTTLPFISALPGGPSEDRWKSLSDMLLPKTIPNLSQVFP